jgi:hypothetical protein
MSIWLLGHCWMDAPKQPEESAEDREAAQKSAAAIKDYREWEEARRAAYQEKRERLQPEFALFAAKFRTNGKPWPENAAFGKWLNLHSKNQAPTAADVPDGNSLEIMDFLKAFQRQREEAARMEAREKGQSVSIAASSPNDDALSRRMTPTCLTGHFPQNTSYGKAV